MKCPQCHQTVELKDNPFRPFCSERCKLIDLGMWIGEQYRIPGQSLVLDPDELNFGKEHPGDTHGIKNQPPTPPSTSDDQESRDE